MSVLAIRELNKTDRCDRCGAAASIALRFKSGEIMFCGHHYTEHSLPLLKSGAVVTGQIRNEE